MSEAWQRLPIFSGISRIWRGAKWILNRCFGPSQDLDINRGPESRLLFLGVSIFSIHVAQLLGALEAELVVPLLRSSCRRHIWLSPRWLAFLAHLTPNLRAAIQIMLAKPRKLSLLVKLESDVMILQQSHVAIRTHFSWTQYHARDQVNLLGHKSFYPSKITLIICLRMSSSG
jgi:hypothetical protein